MDPAAKKLARLMVLKEKMNKNKRSEEDLLMNTQNMIMDAMIKEAEKGEAHPDSQKAGEDFATARRINKIVDRKQPTAMRERAYILLEAFGVHMNIEPEEDQPVTTIKQEIADTTEDENSEVGTETEKKAKDEPVDEKKEDEEKKEEEMKEVEKKDESGEETKEKKTEEGRKMESGERRNERGYSNDRRGGEDRKREGERRHFGRYEDYRKMNDDSRKRDHYGYNNKERRYDNRESWEFNKGRNHYYRDETRDKMRREEDRPSTSSAYSSAYLSYPRCDNYHIPFACPPAHRSGHSSYSSGDQRSKTNYSQSSFQRQKD